MTAHSRRTARTVVATAIVLAAGSLVASCGVPLDNGPRTITQTTLPPTEDTTTIVASDTNQEASVYFLRDDRLERVGYPVEGEPTLRQALGFVLAPLGKGADGELRTAVPPGTTLRSVEVTDGVATIDLTGEISDVSGLAQKEAFAQIVFTTLAFEKVTKVRFLLDGEVVDAPTDDGNLSVVTAANYDKPLNPR